MMISYAQNREDVRLRRVFPGQRGFYVDVGARDPSEHSVTRYFHDLGWRGVNVEPRASAFEALCKARPRDVNLNVGLADRAGTVTFYEPARPECGELSTCSAVEASGHRARGIELVDRELEVTTLAQVCERHAPATIDFLSVGGFESAVLAGGDWRRWRPRVVLVEAIRPVSYEPAHEVWEPRLLGAGYLFAAFDGVNRFYVREEDRPLADTLALPVSFRDEFQPYEYLREIEKLRAALDAVQAEPTALRLLKEAAEGQAASAWTEYSALRQELVALKARYEELERALEVKEAVYEVARLIESRERPPARLVGADGDIGPVWRALARRLTRLSRRYPDLATRAKELLGLRRRDGRTG